MRGFCAAHGVEPFLEMRAIGSASRPRHVCVIHLPLPRELHFDFGYSKLIRTGERSMRKKDAVLSATRAALLSLHSESGVDLHALLELSDGAPPGTAAGQRTLSLAELQGAEGSASPTELLRSLAALRLCAGPSIRITQHRVLGKHSGAVLQLNARTDVSVVGGQPMRVTVRAYEREGATWEALQRASLVLSARKLTAELPPPARRALDTALSRLSAGGPCPGLAGAVVLEVPPLPPDVLSVLEGAVAGVRGERDGEERTLLEKSMTDGAGGAALAGQVGGKGVWMVAGAGRETVAGAATNRPLSSSDFDSIASTGTWPLQLGAPPRLPSPPGRYGTAAFPPPPLLPANLPRLPSPHPPLPIDSLGPRLISALEMHQVLLLTGGTGTGKTSRVPQFLMQAFLDAARTQSQRRMQNQGQAQNRGRIQNRGRVQNPGRQQNHGQEQNHGVAAGEEKVGAAGGASGGPGVGLGTPPTSARAVPPPHECRVVVVQPRRISALASAARVASEIGQARLFSVASAAGKTKHGRPASRPASGTARLATVALRQLRVGYSVRLESCPPSRYEPATVEFVTAGVLLRRLAADPLLGFVTHLIVDEAHERAAEVDLLLSELKASVLPARPDLKVLLMSATLDAPLWSSYFNLPPDALLELPQKLSQRFPVRELFLDDLLRPDLFLDGAFPGGASGQPEGGAAPGQRSSSKVAKRKSSSPKPIREVTRPLDAILRQRASEVKAREASAAEEQAREAASAQGGSLDQALCLLAASVVHRLSCIRDTGGGGAILVFLPGRDEIRRVTELLHRAVHCVGGELRPGSFGFGRTGQRSAAPPAESKTSRSPAKNKTSRSPAENKTSPSPASLALHSLHSSVPLHAQRAALAPAPPGFVKVLLATSIAETSLTIPDASFVVDTGRSRRLEWDSNSRATRLRTELTPADAAAQRAGRLGRNAPGLVVRLYSKAVANGRAATAIPEIQTTNLEALALQAAAAAPLRPLASVLAGAPTPPSFAAVADAVRRLVCMGAIAEQGNIPEGGGAMPEQGNIPEGGGALPEQRNMLEGGGAIPEQRRGGIPGGVRPSPGLLPVPLPGPPPPPSPGLRQLGWRLASLPLDPTTGRMLLLGCLLGARDLAVDLASVLGTSRGYVLAAPLGGRPGAAAGPVTAYAQDGIAAAAGTHATAYAAAAAISSDVWLAVLAHRQWRDASKAERRDGAAGAAPKAGRAASDAERSAFDAPGADEARPEFRQVEVMRRDLHRRLDSMGATGVWAARPRDARGGGSIATGGDARPTPSSEPPRLPEFALAEALLCAAATGLAHSSPSLPRSPALATSGCVAAAIDDSSVNGSHRVTALANGGHLSLSSPGTPPFAPPHGTAMSLAAAHRTTASGEWVVFSEMLDVGRTQGDGRPLPPRLIGTTAVSPLPLLMFGGQQLEAVPELQMAILDGWIAGTDRSKGGVHLHAICAARHALSEALEAYAADPSATPPPSTRRLLDAVLRLLSQGPAGTSASEANPVQARGKAGGGGRRGAMEIDGRGGGSGGGPGGGRHRATPGGVAQALPGQQRVEVSTGA